jgi:tetratricopeptide (TPR) repeat protein
MVSMVVLTVIVICAGGLVWLRQHRWRAYAALATPEGMPREALALHAFTRGNACLAEGKFAEAIAAFHQAREIDPKRPHIADRLAEVERQQAASATASGPPRREADRE